MVKFSCVTICTWRYLSLGICKLHILILMVTGLFKLSISYRVSYRSLCFSKWPVSCKLSNLCVELFVVLLYYPYDVYRICSNIPDFAHLCLLFSFLFNLARSDLSKESAFVSFIFFLLFIFNFIDLCYYYFLFPDCLGFIWLLIF